MTEDDTDHRQEGKLVSVGTALSLLGEWFQWWKDTDEAPAKMPNALHIRTSIMLLEAGRLDQNLDVVGKATDVQDRTINDLRTWCAAHQWAVTTEAEADGYPPPDDERTPQSYALYDAAEDDPAVALFEFREDAERVARILNLWGSAGEAERI